MYILCCDGTCTVRAPCHMNLTVLNEQLTNKKYSIRLTKYISVLIHDHISHTHAHTHIHLCLCLPFNNIALIKYHQFSQMQLTLSIYVFSFLWHRVLHLSTPMGLSSGAVNSILLKITNFAKIIYSTLSRIMNNINNCNTNTVKIIYNLFIGKNYHRS